MSNNTNKNDEKKKTETIDKELKKPIYKIIGKEYVDRIYSVITENKYLTYLSIFFLIVIIYLLIAISKLESKINIQVEIPPKIYQQGTIYVGYRKANALFYKIWGEYVARTIGNFSPVNIDNQINKILYLFDPNKIIKIKAEFLRFSKNVKTNLISNTFTPYKVTGTNNGLVTVEGLATKELGADLMKKDLLCSYKMQFKIIDYHLFLENLVTNCKQISKQEKESYLKEIKKEQKKGKK